MATLEEKAQSACESVYESTGVDAYNECYRKKLRALKAGQTAGSVFVTLADLFRRPDEEPIPEPERKALPPIAWVGIGLAVIGTGVAIYMLTRKK